MSPAWAAALAGCVAALVAVLSKIIDVVWFGRGVQINTSVVASNLEAHQDECDKRYAALDQTLKEMRQASVDANVFKLMFENMTTKMLEIQAELGSRIQQIHDIQNQFNAVALKIERLSVIVERPQRARRKAASG